MFTNETLAEIASGRLRSARQLLERSWVAQDPPVLKMTRPFRGEALAEADFGKYSEAEVVTSSAVHLGRARETAAEALALSGKVARARAWADELHERFPQALEFFTRLRGGSFLPLTAPVRKAVAERRS